MVCGFDRIVVFTLCVCGFDVSGDLVCVFCRLVAIWHFRVISWLLIVLGFSACVYALLFTVDGLLFCLLCLRAFDLLISCDLFLCLGRSFLRFWGGLSGVLYLFLYAMYLVFYG